MASKFFKALTKWFGASGFDAASAGGGGGGSPSLDFSVNTNSQYVPLLYP